MKCSYELNPRTDEMGGGWQLRLLEDGRAVAGGAIPVIADNPQGSMVWWNSMPEQDRAHWLAEAKSAKPADGGEQ